MFNFIDSLFAPAFEFMRWIKENLMQAGTVVARGYDLNVWLGWIKLLGPGFGLFITSLITSLIFLTILYNVKTISRVFILFKEWIGRWT
jgi:hypothetical protein